MGLRQGRLEDLDYIVAIKNKAIEFYKDSGINWTEDYPNKEVFKKDIEKSELFILGKEDIIGIVVLNDEEDINYKKVKWEKRERNLVIHRLFINPEYARKGMGKKLLEEVEFYARSNNIMSIKLDTNTGNKGAQSLYRSMGYKLIDEICLEGKEGKFYAIQKILE
ncbi:GNAT family N-acetyltransferase [Clostridium paraputrificum]|uniref:GNAT family N-acetyltransferase n=1 Tax=Clostridium paraputrificum TaxID=29363 RepID=UPI003D32DECE